MEIEHIPEIPIGQENFFPGSLKIILGEFGFNQQIAQPKINFRAIKSTV